MEQIGSRRSVAFGYALLSVVTAMALQLDFAAAAEAESAVRSIEVRSTRDGYVADLVMWAPVDRELAFDVLVDFDRVATWTPNLRESRVVKREVNRVTVEYSGRVHLGALTVPFMTVREVELDPPASIESRQINGTMRRHKSRIDLSQEGAGTRLDYHVEMEPSAIGAALLTRSRIERELRDTFDAAAGEMLRRRSTSPRP